MNRYLSTSLTATLLASLGASAQDKPNVLVIYTDDVGYGDVSCYGAVDVKTPNIDALAANGVRFTDCHVAAATSTPSRYSLLTGEFCWRREGTGVAAGNAGLIIPPETYTLPRLFQDAGYFTAAIGKWHLGLGAETGKQDWNAPLPSHTPASIGFTYSYIMAATSDRVPCVFIEDGSVVGYDPNHPIYVSYREPFPGEPLGSTHPELLTKLKPSHGHDMSIVNGISRIGYMKGGGPALWKDEDIADIIARQTIHAMQRGMEEGQPFFIYCATNDVHVPRYPHDRFRGQSPLGLRGDAIAQLDDTVGQLIAALREMGQLENTIIIFSSDNGPMVDDGYLDEAEIKLGGHQPAGSLRGSKYSVYEGGTRVPMIVSQVGTTTPGQVSNALVSQVDLMASFAEMLGVSLPQGAAPDSRPYPERWMGRDTSSTPWVVTTGYQWGLSILTPQYQYIPAGRAGYARVGWLPSYHESGYLPEEQLLERHIPYNSQNIAPTHPEVVSELANTLERVKECRFWTLPIKFIQQDRPHIRQGNVVWTTAFETIDFL